MTTKIAKTSTPNWCNIHYDLLDLVLSRSSFVDKLAVRGVCSSWRSFAMTHISNLEKSPMLMLPTSKEHRFIDFDSSYDVSDYKTQCNSEDSSDRCLFKVQDKKFVKVKNIPKEIGQCWCVGSSQGWLVFLHEKEYRYHIFNPLFDISIKLPSLPKLRGLVKAILWSDPILSGNKYAIVAIVESEPNIAYAMSQDSEWRFLKGESLHYYDIISFKDYIYALGESCWIEASDFSTYEPTKKITIKTTHLQIPINEIKDVGSHLFTVAMYLVRSQDKFLMVVRYIKAFVETCENGVRKHLPFPYGTKYFYIYKLNEEEKRWVRTYSIGGELLILGENHSVSVTAKSFKGYQKNSICFTDVNTRFIPGFYYVGHDMGLFKLGDNSIELFMGDKIRLAPLPFWVVPQF